VAGCSFTDSQSSTVEFASLDVLLYAIRKLCSAFLQQQLGVFKKQEELRMYPEGKTSEKRLPNQLKVLAANCSCIPSYRHVPEWRHVRADG
jgi:hypothetical protein